MQRSTSQLYIKYVIYCPGTNAEEQPLALYPEYYILSRDQCKGVPPSFISLILYIVKGPMQRSTPWPYILNIIYCPGTNVKEYLLALYPEYHIQSRDQCRGVSTSFISRILYLVQGPMQRSTPWLYILNIIHCQGTKLFNGYIS